MPAVVLNLDALSHNARLMRRQAGRWGVGVLPVLKALGSHPAAVEVLRREGGFGRFGYAEIAEPDFFGAYEAEKTLIQLTPLSRAARVAAVFKRSFQAAPEVLAALNQAAAGRKHEVLLMVDIDDRREGVAPEDFPELLDFALSLPNLIVAGFGATTTCLRGCLPDQRLADDLRALREICLSRGLSRPEISLGGTAWAAWVDRSGPGVITELRLGDPFILGRDIYRQAELPGGPFRMDVCRMEAEVLEVRTRLMTAEPGGAAHHADGLPQPRPVSGSRLRALLDLGRFYGASFFPGPGPNGEGDLEGLDCRLAGAFVAGFSAGYLLLDITDCDQPPQVGQTVSFQPGYWAIAGSFRNPGLTITLAADPAAAGRSETGRHG
jgi:predicted amino acid racemase